VGEQPTAVTPLSLYQKGIKSIKVTQEHAMKAQGTTEAELYSYFNPGDRWGWMFNATPRPLNPQQRDSAPVVREAGWAPRPVWTGAENLAPISTIRLV